MNLAGAPYGRGIFAHLSLGIHGTTRNPITPTSTTIALQRLATPAQSKDSLRVAHPTRLDGAHEAIRVDLALFGPKTSTVLGLADYLRG